MADPFAQTAPAPAAPGPGFLGIPASTWQNLANFGANTAVAANARTPGGFLEYGTGPQGALGEGAIQTQQQAIERNSAMAQQQLLGAQTEQAQMGAAMQALQIPGLQAINKFYTDTGPNGYAAVMGLGQSGQQPQQPDQSQGGYAPAAPGGTAIAPPDTSGARAAPGPSPTGDLAPYSGASAASAGGLTPGAPGSEGTNVYGAAVRNVESQNNYSATNNGGYLGAYQFGTANLQSTGLYKPAPGENLKANQWTGQITIPGYQPMSAAQFAINKPAQDAAWNLQQGHYWDQIQSNHLDSAIGQNVGGVQITQGALIAGTHFAGVNGMMQYLATGGKYNPNDNPANPSKGTYLNDYMNKVNQQIIAQQQAQGGGYDPQTQLNAQDPRGPLLAPGIPTAGKAQEMANALYQRSAHLGMIPGMQAAAAAAKAQADNYAKIADNATTPEDTRAGGALFQNGNVYKLTTPTTLVGPGNVSVQAAESGGVTMNGHPVDEPSVSPVQTNASPAPAAPPAGGGQPPPGAAPGGQIPGAAPGQNSYFDAALSGGPLPPAPPSNGQMLAKPDPFIEESIKNKSDALDTQQREEDADSQAAEMSLTQMQSMKFEGANVQKDTFAPYIQDIQSNAISVAHLFGITDSQMPSLTQKVGNTAALIKNSMSLTMNVAKETSSRMAVQEVQMVQSAQPNLSMPNHGYQIVTDQLSGLAQYKIARSQAFSKWHASLSQADPGARVSQINAGFDAQFNQRITPMAFIANQWMQSPEGQQYMGQYLQYLQKQGPGGQAEIGRLRNQLAYGEQTGLFNTSAGGQ